VFLWLGVCALWLRRTAVVDLSTASEVYSFGEVHAKLGKGEDYIHCSCGYVYTLYGWGRLNPVLANRHL